MKKVDKAILKSIERWKWLETLEPIGDLPGHCSLCEICDYFCHVTDEKKCPIFEVTGVFNCEGTPYDEAISAWYLEKNEAWKVSSKKMRVWLEENLLPLVKEDD